MSFVLQRIGDNLWNGRLDIFPEDKVVHGFSARQGGVSAAPYDTLNMALHVGDDPAAVWENRVRYMRAMGLDAERICSVRQVHGTEIVRVMRRDAGRGAHDYADAMADADALITNDCGVPLMLCFADCVPVLLYDPVRHAGAVIHAGRDGTLHHIAAKTAHRMTEEFGTKPRDLLAGIGPSISAACYPVGAAEAAEFRASMPGHEAEILAEKDGEIHLDLWAANRIQLIGTGIPEEQIDCANICTACEGTWYYSYRASGGTTGRLAAVMELR